MVPQPLGAPPKASYGTVSFVDCLFAVNAARAMFCGLGGRRSI
jgi:hypothetical protein